MKNLLVLLIIPAFIFSACLKAELGEKLLEYHPIPADMQSHGFSTNNTNELIVIIYGGTFLPLPELKQEHFLLTRRNQVIELPAFVRNNNNRVTFRFSEHLENHDGYKLTVMKDAIQPEDFTRRLIIQTVSREED